MVDGLVQKYAGGRYDIRVINLTNGSAEDERLYSSFGLRYVPTFVLLNSDGSVSEKIVGSRTAAQLEAALAKLQ